MRLLFALVFALGLPCVAQEGVTQQGQLPTTSPQRLVWGAPGTGADSSKFWILHTTFARESLGVMVATTNPCTNPINIETSNLNIVPQSHGELSFDMRGNDTANSAFTLRVYKRWITPYKTYDTAWVRGGTNMHAGVPGDTGGQIPSVLSIAYAPLRFQDSTSPVVFEHYPFPGQEKWCVERTTVGAGDTVMLKNFWERYW